MGTMPLLERLQVVWRRWLRRATSAHSVGYIGGSHRNLGDRFMYQAACELFGEVVPIMSAGAETKLSQLGLSGRRMFRGAVLGGGTLINSYGYDVCNAMLDMGVPMVAVGTGAGNGGQDQPPDEDLGSWVEVLGRFRLVGVRGPLSLRRLEAVGVRNAEIVGDLALMYAREDPSACEPPRRFGINLVPRQGIATYDREQLEQVGVACARLMGEGWVPVPIATEQVDVTPLREHICRQAGGNVSVVVPRTVDELLTILSVCRVMISMRLHGAVFASCVGVPTVSVGYSEKCLDFAESMGLEQYHLPIWTVEAEQLYRSVVEIDQRGDALRRNVLGCAQRFRGKLLALAGRVQSLFAG